MSQQPKVTLQELITAVRELTFDRFIIPAFALKQMPGCSLSIILPTASYRGAVKITKPGETEGSTVEVFAFEFTLATQMKELTDALLEAGIVIAYTPYYRETEVMGCLLKVTNRPMDEDITVFRRYFFSDSEICDMIRYYYFRVLDIKDVDLTDDVVGRLVRPSEKHLAIWVAYYLVDRRRLYEAAAGAIGQQFSDGSDYSGSSDASMGSGITTTVNIGSVFSITENPSDGYFYEDFNRVGSDNVWGDRYSFWYKLMLYLRGLLEEQFGDYELRKDNVIPGYICLTRELDFRAYYDSYPFTLSPLSRGILSKTP